MDTKNGIGVCGCFVTSIGLKNCVQMATNPTRTVSLRSAADLGFALAEIRSDRDRTQAQVAQSVGMDRSQLAHLEAGRTGRFLDNVLVLLADLGAEVTIRWSISDPDVEGTTTVTAALPAPPTAARLALAAGIELCLRR